MNGRQAVVPEQLVTRHQLPLVTHAGNFIATACPGSGKTRSVAGRVAYLDERGKKIAALTYTNVGVRELVGCLDREFKFVGGPQHHFETLHGFLLRYVLYPFGHLVMSCKRQPRVYLKDSAPRVLAWYKDKDKVDAKAQQISVHDFKFNSFGELQYVGRLNATWALRVAGSAVRTEKHKWAQRGGTTADDAMYWCLQTLRQRPEVAAALASRFDEIIIDEMQDTSAAQMDCIEVIYSSAKLKSLVLIGDVEQSIYAFQGAAPQVAERLAKAYDLDPLMLSENHRSSQIICDVVSKFSSRKSANVAVGPYRSVLVRPELVIYEPREVGDVIAAFEERVANLSFKPNHLAVVTPTNDMVSRLNGGQILGSLDGRLLRTGRAVAASLSAISGSQVQALGELVLAASFEDEAAQDEVDPVVLRQAVVSFMQGCGPLTLDLPGWITQAAKSLTRASMILTSTPFKTGSQLLRKKQAYAGIIAADAFAAGSASLRATTVHAVKGKSLDAALLVLDLDRFGGSRSDDSLWRDYLTGVGNHSEQVEAHRITYVGLSRAQRFCALAVPSLAADSTVEALVDTGLVHRGRLNDWRILDQKANVPRQQSPDLVDVQQQV